MELNEPLKWRKYLLLTEFGLLSEEDLKGEVVRYPRDGEVKLHQALSEALVITPPGNALFVVKLVPRDEPGRLPNLRITKRGDLKLLPGFLTSWSSYPYTEIWCCRTSMVPSGLSVAGRMVISETDVDSQTVEQLWRTSPRMLEYYHGGASFPHPYLRATRTGWGWHYTIRRTHIPPNRTLASNYTKATLARDFGAAMVLMEEWREQIQLFISHLRSKGAAVLSIEYKAVGSRLTVIDWDTPDDRAVLSR